MEFFLFINEHIKPDGMSNDYKCKCIDQMHAEVEIFTLNVLFDCTLEIFNKRNQQMKLKVLNKIKNVENV